MNIFLTSFTQVFLIAVNTFLISKSMYLGVLISTFMINIVWTYNVKKMSISKFEDRIIYSFGASIGAISGLYFIKIFV